MGTLVTLTGLACNGDAELIVRSMWDSATPIVELDVTALPFDPDHILDSLEQAAATPRPTFPELEAEMLAYRRPENERVDLLIGPWRSLRDTVQTLADSLNAADRTHPGYAAAYDRFRQQYQRLADRAAERDAALRRLDGGHRALARRVVTAAESLRAWEYEAFSDYTDVAATALIKTGRFVNEATTDAAGEALLLLPPGRWWVVARHWDPENPFMEYYWNEPVTVTRVLPVRLPLGTANGTRRWRH
ncbi:MAG: hypothetical protein OER90_12555 [Gemmatimonadota bacterium]|nr:hypothetical protein [Gemmatimonadota bacterium]